MRPLYSVLVSLALFLPGCSTYTPAMKDADGKVLGNSVAEIEPVMLGGSKQWLLIRGADKSRPVLLFIHGGPGSPYMGLAHAFQSELEKHFVVVQWDQRGGGKSYPDTPSSTMNVKQFLSDTHELVLMLKQRFNRDKIYVLGHSWGTYLGLMEARRHPENLYAYIGAGQMVDLTKQEQLSHQFVTERARATANGDALKQLAEIGEPPYQPASKGLDVKYSWLWEYGGMIEGETGPAPFVKALITSCEYSWTDVLNFVRGSSSSVRQIAENEGQAFWQLKAPDASRPFEVPVFFITGEHDRVTPLALVADYERALQAPQKQSYVLKDAGHFAFFTDPARFTDIMLDVVRKTYPAAAGQQAEAAGPSPTAH